MDRGQQRAVHKAILEEMEARTRSVVITPNPRELVLPSHVRITGDSSPFLLEYARPGSRLPSRYVDIDALEERIFHLIQADEVRRAYRPFPRQLVEQATETQQFNRVCRVAEVVFQVSHPPMSDQLINGFPKSLKPDLLLIWATAARQRRKERDACLFATRLAETARAAEKQSVCTVPTTWSIWPRIYAYLWENSAAASRFMRSSSVSILAFESAHRKRLSRLLFRLRCFPVP